MKKTLSFNIPDYLTLHQYMQMNASGKDGKIGKMINIISALTGYDKSEVETWSLDSLNEVFQAYSSLADTKDEFHSLIEWNGVLYGYSHITQMSIGAYSDLELLTKDMDNNLHKIAALLYRPVTKHRFDTLKFTIKQKIKMVNNNVENVFDWYEIEKYNSTKRKDREEQFKQFPANILLGAIGFFLNTASLYLNDTAYSQNKMTRWTKMEKEQQIMEALLQTIGVGSGLFTHSLNPVYLTLQGTKA